MGNGGKESPYLTHYVLDTDTDLEDLKKMGETQAGSDAFSIESGKVWMMTSKGEWKEI